MKGEWLGSFYNTVKSKEIESYAVVRCLPRGVIQPDILATERGARGGIEEQKWAQNSPFCRPCALLYPQQHQVLSRQQH